MSRTVLSWASATTVTLGSAFWQISDSEKNRSFIFNQRPNNKLIIKELGTYGVIACLSLFRQYVGKKKVNYELVKEKKNYCDWVKRNIFVVICVREWVFVLVN